MNSASTTIPVLTIDGGEATGTSSAAKTVSVELSMDCLDSGALYRTFAFRASQYGTNPESVEDVESLAALVIPRIRIIHGRVWIDNRQMGEEIRTPEIGRLVPLLSRNPAVRQKLIPIQRSAVQKWGLVAEGRDMGTVVFPNARLKVFLTASFEVRAQRRLADFKAKKIDITEAQVRRDIVARDRADTERLISPMVPADDAHVIDTDPLTREEVAATIIGLWKKANRPR